MPVLRKKSRRAHKKAGSALQGIGEEHVGRLEVAALAVVEVEDEVIFEDVVVGRKAKFAGGLVDGGAGAFEFNEGAEGGFVEINDEAFGPFEAGGKTIGGAELFIAKPAFEAQAFEDFLERGRVGEDHFDFLADLVDAVSGGRGRADGQLVGGGFEGQEDARRGLLGRRRLALGGRLAA